MRAALLCSVLALAALAGCATPAAPAPLEEAAVAPAGASQPMDWSRGNWWAYHARIEDVSFDIALIVHDATAEAFRLGTNLSAGFFGLPWSGNVTRDLNPHIGPDVWPLFDFPLADGKAWTYRMLGHEARTVARAAEVDVPGLGARAGFHLESTSYGQVFARYTYVPEVAWFTRLELIEPTDGHTVLLAELTAFGPDWGQAYFVEETVRELRVLYPTLPGRVEIELPSGYLQLSATLSVKAEGGAAQAELRDASGRPLARGEALVATQDVERASARPRGATVWTLDHRGAGLAQVHVEITGLSATGPLAEPASPPPPLELARFLQSTLPDRPQLGHVTSTGPPVGV